MLSSLSSINAVSALSFGRFNKWGEGALRFSQFNQWWVRMNLNFYIIIRGVGVERHSVPKGGPWSAVMKSIRLRIFSTASIDHLIYS